MTALWRDPAVPGTPPPDIAQDAAGSKARRPSPRLLGPLEALDGVGPRLVRLLGRLLGREAPRLVDLLLHLPTGTVDRTPRDDLAGAAAGHTVTLRLRIERHLPSNAARRPYKVRCKHRDAFVHLVFFHARRPHLERALPPGGERLVSGSLQRFGAEWRLVHPEILPLGDGEAPGLRPVYPLTHGLAAWRLRGAVGRALAVLPAAPEWLDPAFRARAGWPSFDEALRALHRPRDAGDVAPDGPARRRLAYDELLASQLALALLRRRDQGAPGRSLVGHGRLTARLRAALPFHPTACQERAIAEIAADMARPERMLRLLQGEVGSGKTLVALHAMLAAVEAGGQAVLMAPTEVLARQHAATLAPLAASLGLRLDLLTGRERGPAREHVLNGLASGATALAVGTHALFQPEVALRDLALAVIDEQHRFGVHQRLDLAAKGAATDLLVMTATPIPRTLMLALYGDMASSELRSRPFGREPISTRALPLSRLAEVTAAVARALRAGEQVFWVCPVIDPAEEGGPAAAEARFAALREAFGDCVALVHGRLPAAQRDRAMRAFARGQARILVATTVIEVGIDVPEASVMVIEQAERFGLAQLHQLRGRVGRGSRPSSCLLLYAPPLGATARARLTALRASADGFHLAEEDLRLRGPGELLGTRQSGVPALRLADLAVHADLLAIARDDARLVLARDPRLDGERGRALRLLLRLFERRQAMLYLRSG